MNEIEEDAKKILITGLDNCGKSSILLCLKNNTNLLSYLRLKPTKGVDISELEDKRESRFALWELGGQWEYRQKHLKNFSNYIGFFSKFSLKTKKTCKFLCIPWFLV